MKSIAILALLFFVLISCVDQQEVPLTELEFSTIDEQKLLESNELAYKNFSELMNNKCMSCHSFGSATNLQVLTEQKDWIREGLIIPGEPNKSAVFLSLSGEGGSMPLSAPELSSLEKSIIKNFILSLKVEEDPNNEIVDNSSEGNSDSENESESDKPEDVYVPVPGPEAPVVIIENNTFNTEELFSNVKTNVLQSKCITCHGPTGVRKRSDFKLDNSQDFVNGGWVVPGKPEESHIYQRLKGANLGIKDEDMPAGFDFKAEELKLVSDWIVSLSPPVRDEDVILEIYSQNFKIKTLELSEQGVTSSILCKADENFTIKLYKGGATDIKNNEVIDEKVLKCSEGVGNYSLGYEKVSELKNITLTLNYKAELVAQKSAEYHLSDLASCEEHEELLETGVRRLSRSQIKNSLNDIFGTSLSYNEIPDLGDGAQTVGMNELKGRLMVTGSNFELLFEMAKLVTNKLLLEKAEFLNCKNSNDETCVKQIGEKYSSMLWRRPASQLNEELDEISAKLGNIDSNESKLKYVMASLILSDRFLFRSELGVEANDGLYYLDDYEIIELLSFSIWDSTPDQTLYNLANKESKITQAEIITQVDRMLASSKAKESISKILIDYLKLEKLFDVDKDLSLGFDATIRESLFHSAKLSLNSSIDFNSNIMSLFSSSNYYVNQSNASIFGLNPTLFTQNYQVVNQASQRYGILNHPAFLASHSMPYVSGIVKRGVFTLEQLLCYDLPEAPTGVESLEIPDDVIVEQISERDLLNITHSAQESCKACHSKIDPAGFGFENFDNIGRFRTTEKNNVPIDSSGKLDSVGEYVLEFNDSKSYSKVINESPQMKECVPRRFLEYYMGVNMEQNSCEVVKYRKNLMENNFSQSGLLRGLVRLESFTKRVRK